MHQEARRLDDNLLTEVPAAVQLLPLLEDFSVGNNRVEVVSETALRGCRRLARLELRGNPLARLHPHALDHLPHLTTLSRAYIRTHSTTCRTSPRCQYHHTHPRPETQPASAPTSARTRPPAAPHHAVSTTTHTHAPRHNPLARLHPHALDHLPHLTTLSVPPHTPHAPRHNPLARLHPHALDHLPHLTTLSYHHTHPRPETQPASAPTSARTRPPAAPHHAVSTTTHTHAPRHNPLARLHPHTLEHLPHLTTLGYGRPDAAHVLSAPGHSPVALTPQRRPRHLG
ncbi:hypothetical protein ACJJTC_004956 [Scirpophaga incertulas]